jgi:hypothetical protein
MYIGKESFNPAPDRESAKSLFARGVQRVEVETHSYCNRKCDYCPNAVGDRLVENKRMTDEVWFHLLSDLKEVGFKGNLVFTSYNEPLADKIILDRVKEAREYVPEAKLMIYTNGDYLTASYLQALADAGLNYLHVSIHTRPGDKYGEIPALNHIAKVVRRMGTAVKFTQIKSGEFIVAKVPHPSIDIEIRAINYWQHGTDRGGLIEGFKPVPDRTLPCYFPFAHFHMGFEGTVVPCCHVRSDSEEHKNYRYGKLTPENSVFELYAGQIATGWRRHLISSEPKMEPCNTCRVGFISQDPKVLAQVNQAWLTHVKQPEQLQQISQNGASTS